MKNISYGYQRVLEYRIKNEQVPSYTKLEKLKNYNASFVEEHAQRAINEYKKLFSSKRTTNNKNK